MTDEHLGNEDACLTIGISGSGLRDTAGRATEGQEVELAREAVQLDVHSKAFFHIWKSAQLKLSFSFRPVLNISTSVSVGFRTD